MAVFAYWEGQKVKSTEISAKEAREKAEKLLDKAKVVFLATNGSHGGHPNLRAMVVAKNEGVVRVWFCTSLGSDKILELVKDDKATLYGYATRAMTEFRLWGSVEILDDMESKKHAWNDEFKEYFPGGVNDPDLRVLRFDARNGVYNTPGGKGGSFTI